MGEISNVCRTPEAQIKNVMVAIAIVLEMIYMTASPNCCHHNLWLHSPVGGISTGLSFFFFYSIRKCKSIYYSRKSDRFL
uniref:Uncharacterized protein n=1 Tax=Pyxicephalus adspersus TaxID=30357 RepID=A0AAV2ZR62_PYXAD|nr:TPA: hypothetical protein GDO54_005265 [Pyxicephalus adspersus]